MRTHVVLGVEISTPVQQQLGNLSVAMGGSNMHRSLAILQNIMMKQNACWCRLPSAWIRKLGCRQTAGEVAGMNRRIKPQLRCRCTPVRSGEQVTENSSTTEMQKLTLGITSNIMPRIRMNSHRRTVQCNEFVMSREWHMI